jgi:hypothetical protein
MNEAPLASLAVDDLARLRSGPAASWGAILAGTAIAISLSLILVVLGAGLGFASVSPWQGHGLAAGGMTVASTIWLIVTQWLSAAAAGYVTGRLRHRWLATHTHEVFFRDTAHGVVTWAVATLIVAVLLTGSAITLIGGGARAVGSLASASAQGGPSLGFADMIVRGPRGPDAGERPDGAYDLDKLFRSSSSGTSSPAVASSRGNDPRMEVMHITGQIVTSGMVSDEDLVYLADLVAAQTGISHDEAQKRVETYIQSVKDAVTKAKAAADTARKSAAAAALYTALALLIGAFIAGVAAAIGGRLRDQHV